MSDGEFRSGFVTIVGQPNVGKSTLLNALMGEKIAIVTPKPQTTRDRILGIRTDAGAQVVFLDTPGIHKPLRALNKAMVERALATLLEVDAVLLTIDVRPQLAAVEQGAKEIPEEDRYVVERVREAAKPTVLLVNKIDTVPDKRLLLPVIDLWKDVLPFRGIVPISAREEEGLGRVMKEVVDFLPAGPKLYEDDALTDRSMRFLVAESIREKVFLLTSQEVPYSVAVEVEKFVRKPRITDIGAVIHVERESQKGILIGKGAAMLKKIGTQARVDIEERLGQKVMLSLLVRVEPDWSERRNTLRRFGYMD